MPHVTGADYSFTHSVRLTIYGPELGHTLPARILGQRKGRAQTTILADSSPPVKVYGGRDVGGNLF